MDYEKYIEKDILESMNFITTDMLWRFYVMLFRRNGRNCRTACGVCG